MKRYITNRYLIAQTTSIRNESDVIVIAESLINIQYNNHSHYLYNVTMLQMGNNKWSQ